MQQQKAGTSTVKTVCSYCGVGCGMVLDVGIGPETAGARCSRRPATRTHPANGGRLCTKGATSADMLSAPGPAGHRAASGTTRGEEPCPRPSRARSARPRGGCARSIDEHGPDAVALLRLRADDASRRSTWRTSSPRASSAPTRSSPTRGCAWPARAPATSCRSAPTARPARTTTSTTPTCSSSSARTWPTATRSCSCG